MLSIIWCTFILCTIKEKTWLIKLWHNVLMRALNRLWISHISLIAFKFLLPIQRRGNLHFFQLYCLLGDGKKKKTFACVSLTKCNMASSTCGYLSSFICSCKALDCRIARKYAITAIPPMTNICFTNIKFVPCCSVSGPLWELNKCSFQCQIML